MPLTRYAFLALALVLMGPAAFAQSDRPVSLAADASLAAVERLALPAMNNDALLARDMQREDPSNPTALQFAEPVDLAITPATRGTWEEIDGMHVWRLVVESPGAYSLNAGFSRFNLPEGAALWIYAPGSEPEYRPFTSADHQPTGDLWLPIVPGGAMVIELNLPTSKAGQPSFDLELARVSHAYRAFGLSDEEARAFGGERGGPCNVDVVCPQGDGYRDIIRSVGAYTRGGTSICSGAAVNNTAQDGRPYFLTAAHCGNSAGNASSVVIYWNYENSTCRPPNTPGAGGPGNGPRTMFSTGTTFRGSGSASDWALLETNQDLDPAWQVFLAGWDRRDQVTESSVAIHHPGVLEKRISFDDDPSIRSNYLQRTPLPTGTHLWVVNWEQGTTEGGSSGSPLFSPEKRIVGQLHGGYAACSNNLDDWYGRVYHSMNTGLAQHLDPGGTGVDYIDGKEAGTGLFSSYSANPTAVAPGDEVTFTLSITNATEENLSGIAFTDALASGLTFGEIVSVTSGDASGTSGTVTWTVDLDQEEEATLVYTAVVNEGQVENITNTATISHPSLEAPIQVAATIGLLIDADVIFINSNVVAIPDNQCPSWTTSTIDVDQDFDWFRVEVGVQIQHTWRGDLRIRVTSPEGTTVNLLERVGGSADNLDALFTDEGPSGAFGSGSHALGTPPFQVEGQSERAGSGDVVHPLANLDGESPEGTWTLSICDGAGQDTGSLQQWGLFFYQPSSSTDEPGQTLTEAFRLAPAYPNPFGSATTIDLVVRDAQAVHAEVFDALGRRVLTLFDGAMAAGEAQALTLEAGALPSGTYVVRVTGETFNASQRVTLVR